MDLRDDTTICAIMEHLIANGATGMARIFGQLFEMAMRIEREQHLKAAHYERTTERLGYANGLSYGFPSFCATQESQINSLTY